MNIYSYSMTSRIIKVNEFDAENNGKLKNDKGNGE